MTSARLSSLSARLLLSQHLSARLSASQLLLDGRTGFERCTAVQHQTLPGLLRGEDMLAKARTGTGKTVAFLLPTIERLAKDQQKASRGTSPIRALVISPTRELAQQISVEADQLMKHHSRLRAGCVVGGTKVSKDIRMFSQGHLDLLVATPGRLEDHLNNTAGFAERLGGVQTLVLDEGQQLCSSALTPLSHADTDPSNHF